MSVTPRIGAPVLVVGQTTPETTVNEITRYLEVVAAGVVIDKDLATAPGSPADGDCYIVAGSPTGAWSGKAKYLAFYVNTAWDFIAPFAGLTMFVQDEAVNYRYSGSAWAAVAGGGTAASLDYDTDGTLAANSDSKIATQKATKTYVDAAIAGGITFATASDINTGTDTTKALNSDALAGSNAGKRVVQIAVTDPAGSALATGDGQAYFRIPSAFDGMNLVSVSGTLITASATGNPAIQIANVTDGVDMLTTKITIDATETDSATAATPAVIDATHDDVATADLLRIDVDVAGSGAKGLIVTLTFQLP